jgi:hypothetical protein
MDLQMNFDAELAEAFGSAHHMVSEHLLVGDFAGFMKGAFDYFTNQGQMNIFFLMFTSCYIYTMFFTFWFNDEGYSFYKCYRNFPGRVIFY